MISIFSILYSKYILDYNNLTWFEPLITRTNYVGPLRIHLGIRDMYIWHKTTLTIFLVKVVPGWSVSLALSLTGENCCLISSQLPLLLIPKGSLKLAEVHQECSKHAWQHEIRLGESIFFWPLGLLNTYSYYFWNRQILSFRRRRLKKEWSKNWETKSFYPISQPSIMDWSFRMSFGGNFRFRDYYSPQGVNHFENALLMHDFML